MSAVVNRIVRKLIRPVERRVATMLARALIKGITDTSKLQTLQLQVRADQDRDDAERFQQFGFTSVPDDDCEAIVIFIGSGDHPIVIATDDRRYRPTGLSKGEVALYTKDHGKRVYCKEDGDVHLGADDESLPDANRVALSGATKDELDALRTALNNFVTTFNTMTLPSGMGPVGPPPVQAVSANPINDVHALNVRAK